MASMRDGGGDELLGILISGAEAYRQFALDYYEQDFNITIIRQIFEHTTISPELIKELNPEISIDDIRDDLLQIGYPH